MHTFTDYLTEVYTVAQILRQGHTLTDQGAKTIKIVWNEVEKTLKSEYPKYEKLPETRYRLVNFITAAFFRYAGKSFRVWNNGSISELAPVRSYTTRIIQSYGAYIFGAGWDQRVKGQLNDPKYISLSPSGPPTFELLERESVRYHETLGTFGTGKPASEYYRVFLKVDVPPGHKLSGYQWVALDRGYCEEEQESMGHCGNAEGRYGDNILSLRDRKNVPHLTFILNGGLLGEMKGRGNTKPVEKYYPAIVQLLLHPEVISIVGGGYLPEKNFDFSDLSPADQAKVIARKPLINRPIEAVIRLAPDMATHLFGVDMHMAPGESNEVVIETDIDDLESIMELVATDEDSKIARTYLDGRSLDVNPTDWFNEPYDALEDMVSPSTLSDILAKTKTSSLADAVRSDILLKQNVNAAFTIAMEEYESDVAYQYITKTLMEGGVEPDEKRSQYYAGSYIRVDITSMTIRTTLDSLYSLFVWMRNHHKQDNVKFYDIFQHIREGKYFQFDWQYVSENTSPSHKKFAPIFAEALDNQL